MLRKFFNGEKAGSYELDGIRFSLIPTTENIIPKKLYYIFSSEKHTSMKPCIFDWQWLIDAVLDVKCSNTILLWGVNYEYAS